jgi:hypothetical protein
VIVIEDAISGCPPKLVSQLDLPTVTNRLIEIPKRVADAVADGRNVERRQRVHVARRQAAETAGTQPGLLLLIQETRQVLAHLRQRFLDSIPDPETDEAVTKMRASQELGR